MPKIVRNIDNTLLVKVLDYDPETEMETAPTFICGDCRVELGAKLRTMVYTCPKCDKHVCISFEDDIEEGRIGS